MRKLTSRGLFGIAIVGCMALGVSAGAAAAVVPDLLAPSGLESDSAKPMPAPEYVKNATGKSYGSAAKANSPENEPDLIQAVATNGKLGYVLKVDLDAANGATAAKSFDSPEDAIAWQESAGAVDKYIAVYDVNGKTRIGDFLVAGDETPTD